MGKWAHGQRESESVSRNNGDDETVSERMSDYIQVFVGGMEMLWNDVLHCVVLHCICTVRHRQATLLTWY